MEENRHKRQKKDISAFLHAAVWINLWSGQTRKKRDTKDDVSLYVFSIYSIGGFKKYIDIHLHQDYEPFLVGNPELNLHLPLLLGGG